MTVTYSACTLMMMMGMGDGVDIQRLYVDDDYDDGDG